MNRVIRAIDHKIVPWKNGGGTTREIFKVENQEGWLFRVSSADVTTDGAFSDYTGFARSLVNLGPGEMTLRSGGEEVAHLRPREVAHFDGGRMIDCRVSAPLTDFNIFSRHDEVFASTIVRQLTSPEFVPVPQSSGLLIYVINGAMVVHDLERNEYGLTAGECLLREPSECVKPDRWMLARASEEPCHYVAVSFRMTTATD